MKIHSYCFYISQDKWQAFLQSYEHFGFKREGGFAYPDYVYKKTSDGRLLKIHIDEPCINVWDGEDKHKQREIWLWDSNRGTCHKESVIPFINDLVDAGFVDLGVVQ